eukprot:TRINITY_DN2215_c1_g2_i1.p1 TRINITY_DN2215_c1_g2~~TRINITY_DN2215_c1_g2_i1.p1  ORF type:complete len:480 (-),score=183.24 TRINITY_DN2215_c1_g2_i1:145-1584(-)
MDNRFPLMTGVSGVRGIAGKSLTPETVGRYVAAFGIIQNEQMENNEDNNNNNEGKKEKKIILGRDSRVSGPWLELQAQSQLIALGYDIVLVGIVPTPTVQYLVESENAAGGIIITSSHNPVEWNGLKFVEDTGLFVSPKKSNDIYELAESDSLPVGCYEKYDKIGKIIDKRATLYKKHIKSIFDLEYIHPEEIKEKNFKVCLDTVNGAGGPILVEMLQELNCEIIELNTEPTGLFAHTPEPVPQNLSQLCESVKENNADIGIAVDPDVDRCVLIDENGKPLNEEYTLALAVDFILGCGKKGNVCKNLSTSRVIDDICEKYGCECIAAAVGEINVANEMVKSNAIIGGEGNGGVILPDIHIGRDAPVAATLVLQHLTNFGKTISQLKATLPQYQIVKLKAPIAGLNPDEVIEYFINKWKDQGKLNTLDGVRMDNDEGWIHLRKSNTEPIIRVIGEASPNSSKSSLEFCKAVLDEVVAMKS